MTVRSTDVWNSSSNHHINRQCNIAFSSKVRKPGSISVPPSYLQAEAALEGLVTIAENFHCRGEWEGCAKWCDLAIRFAKGLPNSPASPSKSAETTENVRDDSLANAANSMLASLFTLRGGYQYRAMVR